jgi:hypothetical protein
MRIYSHFFSCLLPLLQTIYALMKFAQKQDIFVFDYGITIKMSHGQFTIQIVPQTMCLIFSKSTRICLIIITTQFAFEVEGSFIEPQRLKC